MRHSSLQWRRIGAILPRREGKQVARQPDNSSSVGLWNHERDEDRNANGNLSALPAITEFAEAAGIIPQVRRRMDISQE
jgi:hypothetical protein